MTLLLLPFLMASASADTVSLESLVAQNPGLVQSQKDLVSLRTMVDAVLADPSNPKSRLLLENLVQERLTQHYDDVQRKKREALGQGLRVSREMKAPADTQMRIIQALKALPAAQAGSRGNLFLSLLHEAVNHFDAGRESEGVATLLAAMNLNPAFSDAIARMSREQAQPALQASSPAAAEEAPAAPPAPRRTAVAAGRRVVAARRAPVLPPPEAPPPAEPPPPVRLVKPGEVNLGQYYFGVGLRAYSAGKLDEAVQAFRQSLEHDPGNEWPSRASRPPSRASRPLSRNLRPRSRRSRLPGSGSRRAGRWSASPSPRRQPDGAIGRTSPGEETGSGPSLNASTGTVSSGAQSRMRTPRSAAASCRPA